MSRTSGVLLGLVAGVAVFGLLIPYLMVHWALLYLFSFGEAPSPRWGLLTVAIFLVLLGWLAWRNRRSGVLRGLFVGGLAGLLGAVAVLIIIAHRNESARTERERVIFSGPTPLASLQILDSNAQPIWRIVALGEPHIVERVRYGALPPGYSQEVPTRGPPRPFRVTEPLRIEARMVSRIEIRTGNAPAGTESGSWSTGAKIARRSSSGRNHHESAPA